ncbi:response regulator [Paenibacillus sp. GYB004]
MSLFAIRAKRFVLHRRDISIPVMEGIQAVKEIRTPDPKANIIMCSAMGQTSLVIGAIQGGAKDFIMKPFQTRHVLEAVHKAIIHAKPTGIS